MSNQSEKTTVTLTVDGMACDGCSSSVSKALKSVDGVTEASADHEKGTASAKYHKRAVSRDDLTQAVNDAGYAVKKVD